MEMRKQIYNLTIQEVLEKFDSGLSGISEEEAEKRAKVYGLNQIKEKTNWKWLKLVLAQFSDALVWILLAAAALSFAFHEYRDTSIILVIVGINAIIGFFQEFKAERILSKIKKLTADKALVVRNGKKTEIDSKFLVPGDVVFLSSGDNVPADGYLLESYDLKVNSFIFTGESKPDKRMAMTIKGENIHFTEIDNMVFMGETAATGEAKFIITDIGMQTELGNIANLTQSIKDDLTPLQKRMRTLGRNVATLSICIGVMVMIIGHYFQLSWYQNFLFALALSVSVVPEGLPAAMSVALSLGMRRLLKKNVLVKRLNAVETLGSVSMICSDKTGTITKNELTVTKILINNGIIEVSGNGYEPEGDFYVNGKIINFRDNKNLELILKIGTLCNSADLIKNGKDYKIIGDPTEGAIIVAGKKYNNTEGFYEKEEIKINENPFSSERMRMSIIFKNNDAVSYVKGSPDALINLCALKNISGEVSVFTEEEKEKIKETYDSMSEDALRVLAFAYRNLENIPEEKYLEESEKELIWVGMMAMIDPPRKDVALAIEECKRLGIKVIMITGDYEITARAIAKKVGLISEQKSDNSELVINGKTLDSIDDQKLFEKIRNGTSVFARITPSQKLRIASVLKDNGETIAMTGDGVNDAPALKKADIGVAMGIMGTDVSKEASDIILLDDNFASIVNGIKEGRTIYQNIKKFVYYVFTSNVSELLTVIIGVIFGIPTPVTAIQILAVDLGTDVFPSLSLGVEPAEPESKTNKLTEKRHIIGAKGFWRLLYNGVIMAIGAAVTFIWSMKRGGWIFGEAINFSDALYIKSTAAAYAVLAMTQMANLMQARSEKLSVFKIGFFKNRFAIVSILISVGMLLSFMYIPFMQRYLHMAPIDPLDWLMVAISVIVVFLFEEARKAENSPC
ncbi:MAG: cation-transporting P-type ATPase [bacterium]|nr:cation-transporting P-type ATPase [bacterium]